MIPPPVLSSFPGLTNLLLSLLAPNSSRPSAACSTKINICRHQFHRLTLIKAWHFGRTHEETLKLLNENQHIEIHGNYAEGKLFAVVASPCPARNVPYTTLSFCSTTNCLNLNFQNNYKSNHKVTLYEVVCPVIYFILNPTEGNNYRECKERWINSPISITYLLHRRQRIWDFSL